MSEPNQAPNSERTLAGPHPAGSPETNPLAWMQWDCEWRAKLRYMRADAMLKARGGAS